MTEIDRQELIHVAKRDYCEILKREVAYKNCNRISSVCSVRSRTIKNLDTIKSKDIRYMAKQSEIELITKVGLVMEASMASRLWNTISRIRGIKLANDILKIIHGDIVTNSKLYHQGRNESPECDLCGEFDDLNHKIFECCKVKSCWTTLISNKLLIGAPTLSELIENNSHSPKALMLISKVAMLCIYSKIPTKEIPDVAVDLLTRVGVIIERL